VSFLSSCRLLGQPLVVSRLEQLRLRRQLRSFATSEAVVFASSRACPQAGPVSRLQRCLINTRSTFGRHSLIHIPAVSRLPKGLWALFDMSATTKRKRPDSKFYAVRVGGKPGIYHSWPDCLEQVKGYKGAICKCGCEHLRFALTSSDKSFTSLTEAESFVSGSGPFKSSHSKFYAVKHGHRPGIYNDWPTAQKQITNFLKPKHKSFTTRAEAEAFLRERSPPPLISAGNIFQPEAAAVEAEDPEDPPTKRIKRSEIAAPHIVKADAEGWLVGQGTLPPHELGEGDVDGFDYTLKMDGETGKLKRKTPNEIDATKVVTVKKVTTGGNEWIKVWTDGACRANGKRGAVAGVGVWFGPNDPR
jgi:ribonuclease HI